MFIPDVDSQFAGQVGMFNRNILQTEVPGTDGLRARAGGLVCVWKTTGPLTAVDLQMRVLDCQLKATLVSFRSAGGRKCLFKILILILGHSDSIKTLKYEI